MNHLRGPIARLRPSWSARARVVVLAVERRRRRTQRPKLRIFLKEFDYGMTWTVICPMYFLKNFLDG